MKKIILFIFLSFHFINLFSQVDYFFQIRSNDNLNSIGSIQLESGDYIFATNYYTSDKVSYYSLSKYNYFGNIKGQKKYKNDDTSFTSANILINEKNNIECVVFNFIDNKRKSYNIIEYNSDLEIVNKHKEKYIPDGSESFFRTGLRVKKYISVFFYVTFGADNFIDVYYGDKYYRKFFTGYIYDIQILNDEYFFIYKADEITGDAIVQKIRIEDFSIVKTFNLEQELASVFYLGPDVLFSFDYVMGKYFFIKNDKLYFFNNHQFYAYNDFHRDNDFVVLDIDLENFLKIATPETYEDERNSNADDYLAKAVDGSYFALNYLMKGGIRLTKLDSNFDIIFSKVYYIPWFWVNTVVPTIDGGCLVIIRDYDDSFFVSTYKFDKDGNIQTKQEISDNTDFVVYPNPVSDILKIQNTQLLQNSEITIFNMYGQKIFTKNLDSFLNTIDVSAYETGVYFYWLIKEDKVQQKGKFVVRR